MRDKGHIPDMALTAMLRQIPAKFRAMVAMIAVMAGFAKDTYGKPAAEKIPGSGGPVQRAAQAGTVISVVVIAVIGLVGVLILSRVNSALPDITNSELSNSSDSILSGFAGAMELLPVVLIVLIAALVIGVVQRIRA